MLTKQLLLRHLDFFVHIQLQESIIIVKVVVSPCLPGRFIIARIAIYTKHAVARGILLSAFIDKSRSVGLALANHTFPFFVNCMVAIGGSYKHALDKS